VTRSAELSAAARARIERLMPEAEGRSRPWRYQREVVEGDRFPLSIRGGRKNAKESTRSLPLSEYSAPGGLRQGPGHAAASPAEARTV
jgi:hypothetical protein